MIENYFLIIKMVICGGIWRLWSRKMSFSDFSHFFLNRNFCKCKSEKWTKIILIANGMPRNLVRMWFAVILCIESCQIKKKSLLTLFSDITHLYPTVPNLTVWEQVKFKFFGKFRIFCPISELWDHKRIMLNGGSSKRCFFGVL